MTSLRRKLHTASLAVRYHKKHIIVSVLAVMAFISSLTFCGGTWQDADGMTKSAIDQVDDICSMQGLDSVKEKVAVVFNPAEETLMIGPYEIKNVNLLTSVNKIIVGLAFCFLTLSFFASFCTPRIADSSGIYLLFKFMLFSIGVILVFKSQELCFSIANLGTGIANKVAGIANDSVDVDTINSIKQLVYDECNVEASGLLAGLTEFFAALGVWLQLLIPSISMWIVSIIIDVTCFSRAFEIIILSTMSPFAFADATDLDNFGRGSGSRFLKNIAALALSGTIIIFIMALCTSTSISILQTALVSGKFSDFLACTKSLVIIGFAEAGLVLKSQSLAKTVCGVG